ncbi:9693_t:CDS:2, partial [Racocetra persica]
MSNKDLFKKFEFGQKFEYASFENKVEISEGKFGAICKAYLKDIKQTVALKTLYNYDEKSLDNWIKQVKYTIEVNHNNIIQFFGITQGMLIFIKWINILYKDSSEKDTVGEKFEYTSFEKLKEIGRGFGVVYKSYLKDKEQTVALKTLGHDDRKLFYNFVKE